MPMKKVVALFVMLVGLVLGGPLRAREQHFPIELVPEFNIPRVQEPPTIDGRIHSNEWDRAVQLQGVTSAHSIKYFGRETRFWWTWDSNHLYMGTRSSIRPGERLVKQKRQRFTQGVVFDDSYEFGIDLKERNKTPGEAPFFFKFILNAVQAGEYQKIYPSIGQSMFNWYPRFDIANTRWEDDEGNRWWDMEIAMDLDDLQMPRKHKPGDIVGLLMARDYKFPWRQVSMPTATGFLVSRGFPRGTLTDGEPFVQIEKLDGLLDRKVNLEARISNSGQKAANIKAILKIRSVKGRNEPGDEILWKVEEDFNLKAGQDARFEVAKTVPQPKAFLDLKISSIDDGEATPVYEYHTFFQEDEKKSFLSYNRKPPDFPLSARFNPVECKLWLAGDTLDAQVKDRDSIAAMKWIVRSGDEVLRKGKVEKTVYWKFQELIELPKLKPGKYSVRAALVDEKGEELLVRSQGFSKKNEAKVFAEWWDNDIGSPDQILRPFEAIRVDRQKNGTKVSPVLRTYELDGIGLPREIQSNGGAVLNSPARIVVVSNGRTHVVPTDGTVQLTDTRPWRVNFRGSSRAAGLQFRTEGTIEQDGLTDIRLTYRPVEKPVQVEEFRIEWPVDDTFNNRMVVIGPGGNYATREIGSVAAGQGVVWDSLSALGTQGSGMTKGNFYSNVWVGTEKRGLLWAGDSDRGWVPSNISPAHSLKRTGNTLIIRNHIIGTPPGEEPELVEEERTVRFQYNASPFRPLDKGFRVNLRSAGNGFGGQAGYMLNEEENIDGWHLLHPPTKDKSEWPKWYARWRKHNVRYQGRTLYNGPQRQKRWNDCQIPLRGYGPKSIEPGVYKYFRADWLPQNSGDELLTKTYTDYTIHLMDRMAEEALMRQFYYDIAFASKMLTNLTSGDGYILPDGRTQPEAGDDELRYYALRSYAMMIENGVYPPGISGHATNAFCLKALPWFDAMLDSEYPMRDSVDVYPSDRMIAMSCPHNFGVGINHLGNMNARWAALHDASLSGASAFRKRAFDHPAFKHWGITFDDLEFIPYWRNDNHVRRIAPGLLASIWKRPHSLILGVINYGPDPKGFEERRKLALTLNLEELGIPIGAEGSRVRVSEFLPREDRLEKLSLDRTTGALTGSQIAYHRTHFVAIYWEDRPVGGEWEEVIGKDVSRAALDWGINRAEAVEIGSGENGLVEAQNEKMRVHAWRRKNSVLLKVANTTPERQIGLIDLDIEKLGVRVDPEKERWLRFTQTYPIGGKGSFGYDANSGQVNIKLPGGGVRYFCIDKF